MCKVLAGNEGGTAGLLPRPSKDGVFCLKMQPRPMGRGFFVTAKAAPNETAGARDRERQDDEEEL